MKSEKVREQAFRDYQEGMKYKEIAEKYGVSLSTVKSWASRYWKKGCNLEEKKLQPKGEKGCNQKKRVKEPLRKMLVKYWKMLI